MHALVFAIVVAVAAFVCGLVGLKLHVWLPERHAPDRSREMIAATTGLLGLMLSLVLGTLVGSSYTLYAAQKSAIETLSARVLQLDAALEAFGPETAQAREGVRKALTDTYAKIWGDRAADANDLNIKSVAGASKGFNQFLLTLKPETDVQKQVLGTATSVASQMALTEITMMLQLASAINWPMLVIVVCWSLLLFCGYGLVSPVNATVIVSMALGATVVASAIFLIIELSDPYQGLFKIPPGAIIETMKALGP